jgi:hypothetical protein
LKKAQKNIQINEERKKKIEEEEKKLEAQKPNIEGDVGLDKLKNKEKEIIPKIDALIKVLKRFGKGGVEGDIVNQLQEAKKALAEIDIVLKEWEEESDGDDKETAKSFIVQIQDKKERVAEVITDISGDIINKNDASKTRLYEGIKRKLKGFESAYDKMPEAKEPEVVAVAPKVAEPEVVAKPVAEAKPGRRRRRRRRRRRWRRWRRSDPKS